MDKETMLLESVTYNPEDGTIYWKDTRPDYHFKTESSKKRWYTMFAGRPVSGECVFGRTSYIHVRLNGRKYKAHRVAWFLYYGVWPIGDIDHIDGDGLNNKIQNLRDVPRQINCRNGSMHKNNTTGVAGVNFRKDNGKWVARGSKIVEGKFVREYLGQFDTLDEAKKARKDWEDTQGDFTERHGK